MNDLGSPIPNPRGLNPELPTNEPRTIGVLISGRGSNLQALVDAASEGRLAARIAVVISNRESAGGLERARAAGIETLVIDHRGFAVRDDFDRAIAGELRARGYLSCAGRLYAARWRPLLEAFPNAILNIHPSLLPAFPGVDAQQQALAYGVKITGATVHWLRASSTPAPSCSRPRCRFASSTQSRRYPRES
jgi:phosphoribosylglycinamide formyltransferase-1